MKILCFGAGAIGSYIGGSLALIGNPLVFVERFSHLRALRENGIYITDVHGETHHLTRFEVYPSAEEAFARHEFDLVIPAVKSFNTDEVIKALRLYGGNVPPILSLQNGVENEEKYAAAFGKEKVIPCSVCTAVSRGETGAIRVAKLRGIGIADTHPLCDELMQECAEAGLKPKRMKDGSAMKWSKMISNLLSNAASAIFNMTPAKVYANPETYALEIRQLREALDVMKALGINPVNIPGVPLRALCFAVRCLPLCLSRPLLTKAVGGARGSKMPSFAIDLAAGRQQSEVEFLNGAVVRKGQETGIPTPVNRAYYETLTALAAGTLSRQVYDHHPEALNIGE